MLQHNDNNNSNKKERDKTKIPNTKTAEVGSAKRNILRKTNKGKGKGGKLYLNNDNPYKENIVKKPTKK